MLGCRRRRKKKNKKCVSDHQVFFFCFFVFSFVSFFVCTLFPVCLELDDPVHQQIRLEARVLRAANLCNALGLTKRKQHSVRQQTPQCEHDRHKHNSTTKKRERKKKKKSSGFTVKNKSGFMNEEVTGTTVTQKPLESFPKKTEMVKMEDRKIKFSHHRHHVIQGKGGHLRHAQKHSHSRVHCWRCCHRISRAGRISRRGSPGEEQNCGENHTGRSRKEKPIKREKRLYKKKFCC